MRARDLGERLPGFELGAQLLRRDADVLRDAEVGPAPVRAFAVTPALREWYTEGDEEEGAFGGEGGDGGGEIVAWGPPEDIVKAPRSYTGKFLAPVLKKASGKPRKSSSASEAAE